MLKFLRSLIKIGLVLIFFTELGIAQEAQKLPEAPQRGTPEGSSTAGGTRTEPEIGGVCNNNNQSIAYLLDSEIRDYTLLAYPTFWFYVSHTAEEFGYMEFTLAESQTDKTVYRTTIKPKERAGIMGISLPQVKQYALEPEKDYSWRLQINCRQSQQQADIILAGWVRRLPMNPQLKNQLEAFPFQKYTVYMQHNILYDALTNLVELRQQKPTNPQIEQAWLELLRDLGRQELVEQPIVGLFSFSPEE